jgi:iron complex outermembrane receptor protein
VLVRRDATALTGSITGGSIGLSQAIYTIDAPLDDTTSLKTFTQELRLASNSSGPFQWVVGGFYSHIKRDYAQDLFVKGFSAASGIPSASDVAPTDHLYYSTVPTPRSSTRFRRGDLFGDLTGSTSPPACATPTTRKTVR